MTCIIKEKNICKLDILMTCILIYSSFLIWKRNHNIWISEYESERQRLHQTRSWVINIIHLRSLLENKEKKKVEPTIETFRNIGKILVRPSLFMKRVFQMDFNTNFKK